MVQTSKKLSFVLAFCLTYSFSFFEKNFFTINSYLLQQSIFSISTPMSESAITITKTLSEYDILNLYGMLSIYDFPKKVSLISLSEILHPPSDNSLTSNFFPK